MNKPKVTIAIAAYNVESFLKKGMESILNQDYPNTEIILVDDGSTDATARMCDKLAQAHERITVVHKENGGLGSARNTGLDRASGKYIYFFDVDDTVQPNVISRNVEIAEKYSTQLNIFSFNVSYNDNDMTEDILMKERLIESNEQLKKVYCDEILFTKHGNGFVWNKFYRVDFLREHNIHFGNQRIQQDEPFNMQLYPLLERVYMSSEVLYNYVIYSSGNNGQRFLRSKIDILTDVFKKSMAFYKKWGLDDKKVVDFYYRKYMNAVNMAIYANLTHKDNDMSFKENIEYIKAIMKNEDVRKMMEYLNKRNEKIGGYIGLAVEGKAVRLYFYSQIRKKLSDVKHGCLRQT